MVLLDMVATNAEGFRDRHFVGAGWTGDFVVAHYDHGIRGIESQEDADFVQAKCRQYGVRLITAQGNLPPDTSEDKARRARYSFLGQVAKDESAGGAESVYIVTAHHQDDLLETIVMNLVRGTGWRGLAPMNQPRVLRPLLNIAKTELVGYAIEHGLTWREDQTNDSPRYLRNRLRALLASWSPADRAELVRLHRKQKCLRRQIEQELEYYCARHATRDKPGRLVLRRYDLIMLPADVAIEILRRLTKGWLTRSQLGQLLLFIKVGKPSKQLSWKRLNVRLDVRRVYFYPEM